MANNNHFDLTLDTLAPTGSISRGDTQYTNQQLDLTLTSTDTSNFMKVWFDENKPGTKSGAAYEAAEWESFSNTKQTHFTADGIYYYHAVFMDDVANESGVYDTSIIIFDATAPVVVSCSISDPVTGSTTITNLTEGLKLSYKANDGEGPASLDHITVSGDCLSGPITIDCGGAEEVEDIKIFNFKDGIADGTQTLTVVAYDKAGNNSTAVSTSIKLDTQIDTPVITLQSADTEHTTIPDNGYINYHDIEVVLTDTDTSIVGYKVWQGDTEPTEWTAVTSGTALSVTIPMTLSAGDGEKTIHAKVKDEASSEASADDVKVNIDTSVPEVTISASPNAISTQTGYTTSVLTLNTTEDNIASWEIKNGDATIDNGTAEDVPSTYNLTAANLAEGVNAITFTVTDKAGNTTTKTQNILLDTTAPTVSIAKLNEWYNDAFNIQLTYNDVGTQVTQFKIWISTVSDDTTVPQDTSVTVAATTSPQTVSATALELAFSQVKQSPSNYIHVEAVDVVGNKAYAHQVFGFDSEKPFVSNIRFTQDVYTTNSATIKLTAADVGSGVAYYKLTGDIENEDTDWQAYATTRTVTLSGTAGKKTVSVLVKDAAGNISATAATASCELDTTTPAITVALYEADGTTIKPEESPVATCSVRVKATNVDALGGLKYQIYGDYTFGTTQSAQGMLENTAAIAPYAEDTAFALNSFILHEEDDGTKVYKVTTAITAADNTSWASIAGKVTADNTVWRDFVSDADKTNEMTISGLICTTGDGTKTAYIKVIDNAGHLATSDKNYDAFNYDTAAPEVTVNDVDYNRISKIHAERRGSSGVIAGKYADTTIFHWTPSEVIQAYKVCAYATAADAKDGSHDDAAIPTTGGSTNITGTGLSSDAKVESTIRGADFEAALKATAKNMNAGPYVVGDIVENNGDYYSCIKATADSDVSDKTYWLDGCDGAHIVTVYVQDKAGQWSVAAIFTA